MAKGFCEAPIHGLVTIITTSSPTVEQLQTADIVIARVNLSTTLCYTEILNCFGDGRLSEGSADYNGEFRVIQTTWNKANGTLTVNGGSLVGVKLIYIK